MKVNVLVVILSTRRTVRPGCGEGSIVPRRSSFVGRTSGNLLERSKRANGPRRPRAEGTFVAVVSLKAFVDSHRTNVVNYLDHLTGMVDVTSHVVAGVS